MRLHHAIFLALAVAIPGCSDGPTGPSASIGHYVLVAVNDRPLPAVLPPSLGIPSVSYATGDLVLRENGTYAFGAIGYFNGTYAIDGSLLRLEQFPVGGTNRVDALIAGDSVVVNIPATGTGGDVPAGGATPALKYLFRRSTETPSPAATGRAVLTSINGTGAPLTTYDGTINGVRYVERVKFDTITFIDGVTFRRHRAEESLRDGVLLGSREYDGYGSVRARPDTVLLTFYLEPFSSTSTVDRLAAEGQQLVRRVTGTLPLVERYSRP